MKSNLRKTYLAKRRQLPLAYRQEAADFAAQIFINLPCFKESDAIACYLPVKDEFDSRKIIEAIWQFNKRCYLPVLDCHHELGKSLCFVRYREGDPLELNRYDIYEPINHKDQINLSDLDIVITPLIAFDLKGNRLGTGGGYYDRTFSYLEKQKSLHSLHLFGLAFAIQEADLLPNDPWDVPLNGIITEKGFINI